MLYSVQYLRGLAALAVVAYHLGWTKTGLGAAAVDVFFVISGFIMVLVSRPGTNPWVFLRARVLRVVPLYWLATLVMAAMQASDWRMVAESLAFWPHLNEAGNILPVLTAGWSLNYEMFFYSAFAASLALPERAMLPVLTGAFGALCAVRIAVHHPGIVALDVLTRPMLLEFLAGAWLCRAWRAGLVPQGLRAAAVLVTGVVMLQLTAYDHRLWRALVWGLPALLIVAGALGFERSLPRLTWLKILGDASYSLYLTHLPVLIVAGPVLALLSPYAALTLGLAASVAAGLAVHYGIERPMCWLLAAQSRRQRTVEAESAPA